VVILPHQEPGIPAARGICFISSHLKPVNRQIITGRAESQMNGHGMIIAGGLEDESLQIHDIDQRYVAPEETYYAAKN
jgi:hypothetical protein